MKVLMDAYVNFLGHRNLLPQKYIEYMMRKSLELGAPETVLDMFKNHAELLFHPKPELTEEFYQYFKSKGYESLKTFFYIVKDQHLLIKPQDFHTTLIDEAYQNGDK